MHGPRRSWLAVPCGVDQLKPLRLSTLHRLRELKPVILRESAAHRVNPMLITAVLFDEIHSDPESLPFIAHSGLVAGPAQLSVSELIHQKRLPQNPTERRSPGPASSCSTWDEHHLAGSEVSTVEAGHRPAGLMLQASRSTWMPRRLPPILTCTTASWITPLRCWATCRTLSYMG